MLLFPPFAVNSVNTQTGRVACQTDIIFRSSHSFESVLYSRPSHQLMRVQKDKTLTELLTEPEVARSVRVQMAIPFLLEGTVQLVNLSHFRIYRISANKNHSKFESKSPPRSYLPVRGPTATSNPPVGSDRCISGLQRRLSIFAGRR